MNFNDLTQTRLSLLLTDKGSGKLLPSIHVFAELNIFAKPLPYSIHYELAYSENELDIRDWVEGYPSLTSQINQAIATNITQADFNAIENKYDYYLAVLKKLRGNADHLGSPVQRRELINKVVKDEATHIGIAVATQEYNTIRHSYPLGTLASDHAGYLSYDLTNVTKTLQEEWLENPPLPEDCYFTLYPLCLEEFKVNIPILRHARKQVFFAKIILEHAALPPCTKCGLLPSMQTPSLLDWELSPGSFALNPSYFIGADGCENIYPANFATHEFRFFQVIRGSKILSSVRQNPAGGNTSREIRTGWTLEYQTTWQPLGHTLGQIVYSLPLAPGEIIKIAVIDWARKSIDSRFEDLTVKEQLVHNTHRDRNISETVDAALSEWQRGGSIMGGQATSAGGSFGYGPLGVAVGATNAIGAGYSTSSGDRTVHASTVQQVSDAFAQASSSVRELRSTIVVQSDQQEHAKGETRVIANHNHSHALTMLYYEVLRHYKVTTQFMRVRPCILVKYDTEDFDNIDTLIKYRKIIESFLLDERYRECFNAVQKLLCFTTEFERKKKQAALLPDLHDINEFGEFKLVIKTHSATTGFPFVNIVTKNLEKVGCEVIDPIWAAWMRVSRTQFSLPNTVDDGTANLMPPNYRQSGQENVFTVKPFRKVLWNDIRAIEINVRNNDAAGTGASGTWDFDIVQAITTYQNDTWLLLHDLQHVTIDLEVVHSFDVLPYKPIPKDPMDLLSEEERCCVNKLIKHVTDNGHHYQRAIWLTEDPNERAERFIEEVVGTSSLLDLIDNRPLEILGNYVVFPAREFHEPYTFIDANLRIDNVKISKLMTLPTRGVFAEAKLGHCNASEEIDNTRFWDWQTSPIIEEAPGIDNLNINESRNSAPNLTPTAFPSNIVNIVNPSSLPDPTGMTNALNLLGKSDIFRDMSVSKQVEALLEKLSDNSIEIAEAAQQARSIQKQRDDSSNTSNAGGNASPGISNNSQGQAQHDPTKQEIENTERAISAATKLPLKERKEVSQAAGANLKRLVTPSPNLFIQFSSVWAGEGIQQLMTATYIAEVFHPDDTSTMLPTKVDVNPCTWNTQISKRITAFKMTVIHMKPFDGSFSITIPGITVEDLTLKNTTYTFPLRTTTDTMPEQLVAVANKVVRDDKKPELYFQGTCKIGKKDIKVTTKVSGEGELGGDFSKDFEKEASVEILKLAVKSTLKAAIKTTLGGEMAIEGTFEILYIAGFEVKQL